MGKKSVATHQLYNHDITLIVVLPTRIHCLHMLGLVDLELQRYGLCKTWGGVVEVSFKSKPLNIFYSPQILNIQPAIYPICGYFLSLVNSIGIFSL